MSKTLSDLRTAIDEVDRDLLALLNRRLLQRRFFGSRGVDRGLHNGMGDRTCRPDIPSLAGIEVWALTIGLGEGPSGGQGRAVRERRNAQNAEAAIGSLTEAAAGTENLLPRILTCVESEVTVGEISHALRKVWGEYTEAVTV